MANESIGALWLGESKNGTKYMSGEVEIDGVKHKIIVFKNKYKEEDRHPDYRILPKQERQDAGQEKAEQDNAFEDEVPF